MTVIVPVQVQRLAHALPELPAYATPGAAAMDLQAAIEKPLTLAPLERSLVPTGLIIALPEGFEAQIRPRSGLAIKHGISLINAVGTIDSDYRHEVKIPIVNLSSIPYTIQPGDRIAQLLAAPVSRAEWLEVAEISQDTERSGGFGSTGFGAKKPDVKVLANSQ